MLPAIHPDEFTSSKKDEGKVSVVEIGKKARLPWTMLYDQRGTVALAK